MSYIGTGVETVTFNTATTLDVAGNITLGGTVDGRDVATDGTKLDTITSGAIADILQDTTPQLGGNLDLNTSNVIGTGNINVTGSITGTSFVSTGNMSFTNNSKAIFGTSPSLEIYHDGSNSILDDVGAGNFKMQLAGSDKLEITSTGVDVTGAISSNKGSAGTLATFTDGVNSNFVVETSSLLTTIGNGGGSAALALKANNTEALRISATGSIGIGTNAPSNTLSVEGSGTGLSINSTNDEVKKIVFENSGSTTGYIGSSSSSPIRLLDSSATERLRIDSSGNVGIGTSSPAGHRLKVEGGTTYLLDHLYIAGGLGKMVSSDSASNPLIFGRNASEDMRIDSSGNVGIADTSPVSLLTVNKGNVTGAGQWASSAIAIANPTNIGAYSQISFGYTAASNASAYIGYVSTNQGANGYGDLVFGTRSVNTNTQPSERMRITSAGQTYTNGVPPQSIATFNSRKSGAAIEFGHANNGGGYYGTLGSYGGGGQPYIGFSADAEDSLNTFTTRGFKGNLIAGGSDGSLHFSQLTNASSTGQTPVTRMTIDPSGNVGIGASSIAAASAGTNVNIHSPSAHTTYLKLSNSSTSNGTGDGFDLICDTNGGGYVWTRENNHLYFGTNNTERMRLTSIGHLGINQNNPSFPLVVSGKAANHASAFQVATNGYAGALWYNSSGSVVGQVQINASSTAYITTSDYRLKENVTADWDATTRLKQLNPVRFNFIADADTTVDGFLAHEVQDVVPEAISGTKDAVDEDGNPEYQGIDQSKLVPLLVKTIQELEARIAALENT
jgi:hypothetical protein